MALVTFDFDGQLAFGKTGENAVIRHLLAKGLQVADLSDDWRFRRRDVDLMVEQWFVEVKTDTHAYRNLFVELTVDGRPGYLYKSRADYLLTHFVKSGDLLWTPLSTLCWWVREHGDSLQHRVIHSRRRDRTWTAEGVLIPIPKLLAAGLGREERIGG